MQSNCHKSDIGAKHHGPLPVNIDFESLTYYPIKDSDFGDEVVICQLLVGPTVEEEAGEGKSNVILKVEMSNEQNND